MNNTELKPCPFCGGKARIGCVSIGFIHKITGYYAKCELCRASTGVELDEDEVVEKRNRRADDGR